MKPKMRRVKVTRIIYPSLGLLPVAMFLVLISVAIVHHPLNQNTPTQCEVTR